jgi:hypothetical protein
LERSVCSIFIGSVSRKKNQDEIVGVFIQVEIWLRNSLSPSEGGERWRVWGEKQAVEGKDPQVEACSKYVREKRPCVRAKKGGHGLVEIKLLCFRWLSPLFKCVQKGFPQRA